MSYLARQHAVRPTPVADHDTAQIGLAAGTRVLTLAGSVRVEDLKPGDRLITRSGARSLRALHIQPRHDAAMILIPAGALGPDLPAQNLELLPQQQILIRGRRRNATHAVDQTLVSAARLADANGTGSATITDQHLYMLELADAAVIYADGLQLACRAKAAA